VDDNNDEKDGLRLSALLDSMEKSSHSPTLYIILLAYLHILPYKG
jgi:hypothetical protein